MDALSEALRSVRMTGAIFYNAECSASWGFSVPHTDSVAHLLSPGTERLVSYHLLTEGEAVLRFEGEEDIRMVAGDICIIPHGDAHLVWNGTPSRFIDSANNLADYVSGQLVTMRLGGGGHMTRFICGYFGCERRADRLFLAGLPTVILINLRNDAAGAWLESSVRHLVDEAGSRRAGQSILLSRMAEALFIEAIRRYMNELPPGQIGWLAAARDPVVGRVIAHMHREPERRWTLEGLAAEAGTSRSVLSERFARFLGEPPLTYLARWRLELAARHLQTTSEAVIRVAAGVGYDSEAAFCRAFKREFGLPPGLYRKSMSAARSGPERARADRA
jgi:AraC-like DNA-binding protein